MVLLLSSDHCLFRKRISYLCHNCCCYCRRCLHRLFHFHPLNSKRCMIVVHIAWKCVSVAWIKMYDESRLVWHAYVIASSSPPPPRSNAKCKLKCSINSKHTFVWHGKILHGNKHVRSDTYAAYWYRHAMHAEFVCLFILLASPLCLCVCVGVRTVAHLSPFGMALTTPKECPN